MYKVAIADDEILVRTGMKNLIDWSALNCKIIAVCENGTQLLKVIKEESLDIVITDIKMPGADGIEISKYIFENYPKIKVILLTAYADFSYAKKAISFNVVEYVTKTGDFSDLVIAIKKAKKLVDKERREKQEDDIIAGFNIIKETTKYIEANIDKIITVQKIASYMGVNSNYLSRVFRKKTGTTIKNTINQQKIEKAKELLENTDLKIYEIASRIGIDDTAYFVRLFQQYTNMTPKNYRDELSK